MTPIISFLIILSGCSSFIEGRVDIKGDNPKRFRVNIVKLDGSISHSKSLTIGDDNTFKSNGFGEGKYLIEVVSPGHEVSSLKWISHSNKEIIIPIGKKIESSSNSGEIEETIKKDRGSGQSFLSPPQY